MTWKNTSRHARGYDNAYLGLRRSIFERDHYLCQPCKRLGITTAVVVGKPIDRPNSARVDHVKPKAQGGTDDESNLETSCNACHKRKTGAEAHGRSAGGASVDGWPVDPNHAWNSD